MMSNDDDPKTDPEVMVMKFKCPEAMSPTDFGLIKLTAQFVVRYGRYFWLDLVNSMTINPKSQFDFINANDWRFKVLLQLVDAYSKLLIPYRKRSVSNPNQPIFKETLLEGFFKILEGKKQDEEGIEIEGAAVDLHDFSGCLDYFAWSDDGKWSPPGRISAQMLSDGRLVAPPTDDDARGQPVALFTHPDPPIPREYPFTYPKGITRRQLGIIKVTAQFYVRYGYAFWLALVRRVALIQNSQFEFIVSKDRYSSFHRLVSAYSKVLLPSCTCPERAVLKGFFNLLQGEEVGVGMEIFESDFHSFVGALDYFTNRDDQELTPHVYFSSTLAQTPPCLPVPLPKGSPFAILEFQFSRPSVPPRSPPPPLPLSEEPEPKKPKLDKSALVPEDQFLAQHSGSVTIRVSMPNVDTERVIEKTLSISYLVDVAKNSVPVFDFFGLATYVVLKTYLFFF